MTVRPAGGLPFKSLTKHRWLSVDSRRPVAEGGPRSCPLAHLNY
jgi:hypothetical protein